MERPVAGLGAGAEQRSEGNTGPRPARRTRKIEALVITILRPARGLTAADFIAANADIDDYLKRQPGFLWRRISETDDGTVVDIVAYDSTAHALAGASGISGEMAGSPVHASIDQSTVEWRSPASCTS